MISRIRNYLRPHTLLQKTTFFILVPTFLILAVIGMIGLQLVRNALLEQWRQTAIAKLQRSAHSIDMRPMRPKELLRYLQISAGTAEQQPEYQIIRKLALPGKFPYSQGNTTDHPHRQRRDLGSGKQARGNLASD